MLCLHLTWPQLREPWLAGSWDVGRALLCPQGWDVPGCTSHQETWQRSFSLVLFSLGFLLLHKTSLMELPETCRITAFVCLVCQTHLHMNRLGKITLHGCSLPELLLMSLSLAGCQLQTHLFYWGFFSTKGCFSLPNFLHGVISTAQPSLSSVLVKESRWDRVQGEHQGVAGAQTSFSWLYSAKGCYKGQCGRRV